MAAISEKFSASQIEELVFSRKTRKNTVVKIVREVYLRDDIPCYSPVCQQEQCRSSLSQIGASILHPNASHYFIPDIIMSSSYVELFESEEFQNGIFLQTILNWLYRNEQSRKLRRLRRIASNPLRHCVIFNNEIFSPTFTKRHVDETEMERHWRAILLSAKWYADHLAQAIPIIIISDQKKKDFIIEGVKVVALDEYLKEYFPNKRELWDLFDAIRASEEEQNRERLEKGKLTLFNEYYTSGELESGVKSNRYIEGMFRINPLNREQAFVSGGSRFGTDIVIVGSKNQNRAVQGDRVVVEILPENEWICPSSKMQESAETGVEQDVIELGKVRPTGKVIGVSARHWRTYVATLDPETSQGGTHHLCIPLDYGIPKIRIRHSEVKLLRGKRILVRIDDWPSHSTYPMGHYVRTLGDIHDLETEITSILIERNVPTSQILLEFSEASLQEMPQDSPSHPWLPTEEEIENRRDLRSSHIVFSIDPPGCQDIDDAISIKTLPAGQIELGVHIADVSYFVKENSFTDLEARTRGTTVYLADRRYDMLPKVLSEKVCSLRQKVDRFSVSVIWTFDENYNICNVWFGRTIINSVSELEYEQAQAILNGESIVPGLNKELVLLLRKPLNDLGALVRHIRRKRMENGGLELESTEMKLRFNKDSKVTDILPKDSLEVHKVIEECMILANQEVAKRIYQRFPTKALLRRHPFPLQEKFFSLIQSAKAKGIDIDTSTNFSLASSLQKCIERYDIGSEIFSMLKIMATKAMAEANYISSGSFHQEQYAHYGLGLPFYTHFTSPIRRYADLIVHRQLLDANTTTSKFTLSHSQIEELCNNINERNREAKIAQKDSLELFQSLYVLEKTKSGILTASGIVSDVRQNGLIVYVPRYGITSYVYFKDKNEQSQVPKSLFTSKEEDYLIPLTGCEVSFENYSITIRNGSKQIQFHLLDYIKVSLEVLESYAHRNKVTLKIISKERDISKVEKMQTNDYRKVIESGKPGAHVAQETKGSTLLAKQQKTVYDVLEKFRLLTITETSQ